MNGPDHYRKAEQLLADADSYEDDGVSGIARDRRAEAQVHALLALTAATALPTGAVGSAARDMWAHTIHFGDEGGVSDGR